MCWVSLLKWKHGCGEKKERKGRRTVGMEVKSRIQNRKDNV